MKKCPKCDVVGDEYFNRDRTRSDGLSRLCKKCICQYRKDNHTSQRYYLEHKEQCIARSIKNRKKRKGSLSLETRKRRGRPKQSSMKTYFRKLCHGASERNLVMELDESFLCDLLASQNYQCSYSGMNISLEDRTASLDRIDSRHGYTKSNVHWVDKRVNFMKQSMSHDEFIQICKMIVQNIEVTRARIELASPP